MATQRIKNKDGEWVLVNNGGGGSTSDIIVDSELSSESTNPIQNKAVFEGLNNKVEILNVAFDIDVPTSEIKNVDKEINAKTFSKLLNATLSYGTMVQAKFLVCNMYYNGILTAGILPTSEFPELQEITSDDYILYIDCNDPKILNGFVATVIIDKSGDVIFSYIQGRPIQDYIMIPNSSNYISAVKVIDNIFNGVNTPYLPIYPSLRVTITVPGITDSGTTVGTYYIGSVNDRNDPVVGAEFTYISSMTGKVYEVKLDKNSNIISYKELNITEDTPSIYNIGLDDDIIVTGRYKAINTDTIEVYHSYDSKVINLNRIEANATYPSSFGATEDTYDTIYNSNIDTISIESTNVWDGTFEVGKLNGSDIESANEITSGFIEVGENQLYLLIDAGQLDFVIHYYNDNKEHYYYSEKTVVGGNPINISTVSGAKYIRFSTASNYGTFYRNNIAVTNYENITNYSPYGKYDSISVSSLLSVFEGNGLNRIGTVSDSIDLEKGLVKRIGLRDYQEGDENNNSCVVNVPKTKTLYILDTPEYISLSSDQIDLFLKPIVISPGFIIKYNSSLSPFLTGNTPKTTFSYKNNLRYNVAKIKGQLDTLLENK